MNTRIVASLFLTATLAGCGAAPTKESDTLSGVRALTAGFASVGEGRLSDDGRWAVFRATPAGERQPAVYVAPVRGEALGPPARVTPQGTGNGSGLFSPNGAASLYFSSSARGDAGATTVPSRAAMQLFRADGWQSAMAVVERDVGFDFARHPITHDADARSLDATFTPDGKWILFASDRLPDEAAPGTKPDINLWAIRPDGSRLQQLTFARGADRNPAVSPDGRRVCYSADRAGDGRSQLLLADLAEADDRIGLENERPLTNNDRANWAPAWHPSGKWVLFTSAALGEARGGDELWLIRDDGYRRCRLTFTPGFDGLATFSRDGRSILWTSGRTPDGTTQLYRADFRLPDYVTNPDIKNRG